MNIDPIGHEDWVEFISNKFSQTGLEIYPSTIEKILEVSKGHPHYTQYFSSVVWNYISEGEDQNSPEFHQQWLEQIINAQSDIFQNIIDQLTTNQRIVLKALASAEKVQLYAKSTSDKFNFPSDSTLNESVKGLMKKEIITKNNGFYQIVNPILREWLKSI